jgi:hypothetical protein
MKSKQEKRKEAIARLEKSSWKNSKAKRLSTKTKEIWKDEKEKELQRLILKYR